MGRRLSAASVTVHSFILARVSRFVLSATLHVSAGRRRCTLKN